MTKFLLFGFFLITALVFRLVTFDYNPGVKIPQGSVVFDGVLKKEPRLNDRGQILEFANVRVYVDFVPQYRQGDRLRIEGVVDEKGRIFQPSVEKLVESRFPTGKLSSGKSKYSFISELRARIARNIARVLPKKEAFLVQGTILGVDNVDCDFRQQLVNTGTIHVVVVSGQNMAIAAGMFLAFAKYLGRRISVLLALVAVIGYATIAGFEPPVLRAALMVGAATLATLFGREIWSLWSLLVAAFIIVFVNPSAVTEISFQLTFAATLGIMTLGQWLGGKGKEASTVERLGSKVKPNYFTHKQYRHPYLNLISVLLPTTAVAISAYLFTAPLIIFYFGRISLLAPLVNILVIEAVTPIMVIGFVLALASLIFMPLAQIIAYLVFVPAFYFVKVVETFSAIPFGQAEFGEGNIGLLIVLYIVLAGMYLFLYRHSRLDRKSRSSPSRG